MDKRQVLFDELKILSLGMKYLDQKDYTAAIMELNKVLDFNPKNEIAIIKLGHVYLQQKNYLQAIELFNRAQVINPQVMDSYEGLGLCYFEQGNIAEAMGKFNYVLSFDPDNEQGHFGLGLCYQQKEEFDKAIEELNRVEKINCRHFRIYSNLGMCYYQKNDLSRAIGYFNQALKSDPSDCYARKGLAYVYLKQDNPVAGLEQLQKIKDAGLIDEECVNLSAQLYLRQRNYDLAIAEFNKVLDFNPQNKIVIKKLAQVYFQQKKHIEAVRQFNRALEIDSQDIDAHEGLGLCYFEQGCIAQAIEKLNYVLSLDPDNEQGHFGLGLCYQQKEEFDKAIEELNRVEKINCRHFRIYSNLGMCYYQKNDLSRAIEYFNQALKSDPSDCYARKGLVYVYLKQDNPVAGLEQLQKIKDAGLIDEECANLSAQLYIQQKNYDSAIEELLKSISKDSIGKELARKRNFADKQGDCAIKILRIPNFYGPEVLSTEMNSIMLPPLAMGSIVSYLRSQGVAISQDDLHIKIHHDNYFSDDFEKKIDETIFFDELRVIEYTKDKDDLPIDSIMEKVLQKTEFAGYKIILFSLDSCSMNFSHVLFSLCLAKYLKRKYDPIIILGGLTYFPELMRKFGCVWLDIDYAICGEGEEVLSELLISLCGLSLENKTITPVSPRVLYAQNVPLPVKPDFDGLPLDRYRYRGLKADYCRKKSLSNIVKEFNTSQTLLLPVRFIKGCTNKCIFCASSSGGLIHITEPKTAALWLKELQEKYNPAGYLFLNDTLNVSKRYLEQLCEEIIKRKLKVLWSDCVRVDRLDKGSIYKMREAGCIRMVFGMETASKRMLEYINKDINLKHLEEMLYWANKAGIWTGIEIISGLPYETESDVLETISFVKRNKKHIDSLYYNAFNIKDASLLHKYPEKYGLTNVFEISSYEDGFSTFVKYGFDEINGLKWPEKRKQIISAVVKIVTTFGQSPFPEHEYEQFLFFLYSKYDDKKKIKKLFYAVGDEKMRYVKLLRKKKQNVKQPELYESTTLIYGGK